MSNAIGAKYSDPINIGWTLLAGLALWLIIIVAFTRILGTSTDDTEIATVIDAQIVELPEDKPAPSPPKARVRPKPVEKVLLSKPEKPVMPSPPETEPPAPEPVQKTVAEPTTQSSPVSRNVGARAIYQPIPQIPEELRYEALNAVAMARFHINVDGTTTVELIKPTANPRINQIILNTLRTWRFIPALQDGRPVPSIQEIKIHVEVS